MLRAVFEAKSVRFDDVMSAAAMRVDADAVQRAIGENDYPILCAQFIEEHPGIQINVQYAAGIGACLHPGDDGILDLVAVRGTIRFHWQMARAVQKELNELDENALRWLRRKERRSLRFRIYDVITQVHTTVAMENKRHEAGQTDDTPTEHLETELVSIRLQVERVRLRLAEEAERAAQTRYALGMGLGAAILAVLCGIGGACFAAADIPAVYGIGVVAGTLGACLSVFQRLTRGNLKLDYRTDPTMLTWFGALRPAVGAIVGMVAFAVVESGLLSNIVVIPTDTSALLAFVAFLAFLSAFSERFFQDMLRIARPAVSEASLTGGDDGYVPIMPPDASPTSSR
ncbi:MAG TPA: hypothetical protein VFW38_04100 [Solirubrobacteraceae bacterium]|nr:hypothetical protein [Solirubrobacteraceae bacterium]